MATLTRLRKSFGEQAELRDSVTNGGSETAAPLAIDDALRSCLFPQSPWN